MKKFRFIQLIGTSLLALQAVPGAAVAEPFSLNQAVASALSRSPEVGQAEARVGQAEAVKDQAKRDWLPKVTAEGVAGLRRLQNSARNSLGLSALNEKPLYGGVTVEQPVWDMGRRQTYITAQKQQVAAMKEAREAVAEESAFQAARAYLVFILYEQLRLDAHDNLTFHERLSADMRDGVAVGAMSISERQQADERRQLARVRLADAERDLQSARNLFVALIGREPVELTLPDSAAAALPASLEDAVALVAKADPQVRKAEHASAAAEALVRRSRADGLPTLDATGSARTGTDFDGYRGKTDDLSAMLTLRWRLFDGGVNAARVREAMNKAYETSEALIQARRDSERGARDGWAQVATWRTKLAEQEEHARIAKDVVYSYRAQFGIGRRSLLDVLDAQNAAYSAAGERETARISVILAEYALLAQANQLRTYLQVMPKPAYGPE